MKKFFVRDNLLKSLNLQKKHNRLLLAVASAFLLVIVIFATVKLTQRYKISKEEDVAVTNIDENSTNQNPEDTSQNEEANNTDDNQEEEFFTLPEEGTRPYAVMIDNEGTNCLPQGGLHRAQIIYEIIVEGGVTRYMPIFWHNTTDLKGELKPSNEKDNESDEDNTPNEDNTLNEDDILIGPVRSARHYFLDYALEHDAIYVHFGWSPQATRDISSFKVNNINGVLNGWEIFWDITNNPNDWQDSYTSMSKITEYVGKVNYRTETDKKHVFSYNEENKEPAGDNAALNVLIEYSYTYKSQYIYDPETKEYNRLRNNEPHIERTTEKQLKVKNIIIQFNNNYTIKGDPEGRQEVETTGNGEGWYITCGKAIKIKWSKSSRTETTTYTDENGNPIILNPGQTWIQVISPYANVEITG